MMSSDQKIKKNYFERSSVKLRNYLTFLEFKAREIGSLDLRSSVIRKIIIDFNDRIKTNKSRGGEPVCHPIDLEMMTVKFLTAQLLSQYVSKIKFS